LGIPLLLTGGLLGVFFNPWIPMGFQWQSLSAILAAMSILWTLVWTARLKHHGQPRVIQATIGNLIRGLLLTQAALCAACGPTGENVALLILFLFPISGWIGKWFYGS
jgi:Na+/alanine symporter